MQNVKLQTSYTTITSVGQQNQTYKSYQAEYSELGQVMSEQTFDLNGNIIESHSYVYDADGFLVEEKKSVGSDLVVHYKYKYDEFGRMVNKQRRKDEKVLMNTTVELGDFTETEITTGPNNMVISKMDRNFSRDGRLVEIIEYQEDDSPLYIQKFSYDLDGNLTMAEYFDDKEELMELHIRDFDEDGRVIRFEKQDSEGNILQQELFTYEEPGILISLKKLSEEHIFLYNEFGLESEVIEKDPEGNVKRVRKYDYDELGLLFEERIEDKANNAEFLISNTYELYPMVKAEA